MTSPRPIVIAYDGSPPAQAAIEQAGALLQFCRAVVVHVWAPIEVAVPASLLGAPAGVAVAGARGLDATEKQRAERVAEEGTELARRAGFAAEALAIRRDGPPWRALVKCAVELDAAAIVTGTRSRSRPAAAVLGSTAEGVLHHAHRAVLVVSAP
ncbi:MAG TPA: universal stress protein [Solirubrobacteraceae bacterium]|nr:universal stress protein [Solirubrobacteraceae bacterium]